MDFGKTIKELRLNAGIGQKDLARHLGLTTAALWKAENGRSVPKHGTIQKVCNFFHVPLAYFYQKSMTIEDFIFPDE